MQVAARELNATDMQLAYNSDREGALRRIKDVQARVGNWAADRNDPRGAAGFARCKTDIDGGFRRPVEVAQLSLKLFEEALLKPRG
jgi:hypothetical protein